MKTIPRKQVLDRWDTLPQVLRDALTDTVNSDLIWSTCESEHIPEERIRDASRVISYVLFGFLHPGDLSKELAETLRIDVRIATVISSSVITRIVAPLQQEIDKIYAPVLSGASAPIIGPKMLEDVSSPVPVGGAMVSSFPAVGMETPPPAPPWKGGGAGVSVPPPSPMSASGWSKMPVGSVSSVSTSSNSPLSAGGGSASSGEKGRMQLPTPISFSAPNLQKTEMGKIAIPAPTNDGTTPNPSLSSEGGFASGGERRGTAGSSFLSASVPSKPYTPNHSPSPAPVMFSDDATVKQIQKAPDFKMVSDDKIASASKFVATAGASTKSAVLEFSGARPPLPPPVSTPRVVNYADVPPVEGRHVTEMTGGGALNIKQENVQQKAVGLPPTPPKRDAGVAGATPMPTVPNPPIPPNPPGR